MTKLEKYLREKIDYKNKMHDFDLGTETLKIWLDEYNVSRRSEKLVCDMCGSSRLEHCGGGDYSCEECGHYPITN